MKESDERSLYEILGVDKNASDAEIKKAYREKAKKHHPDVNNGEDGEFKLVSEAHAILINSMTRERYDNTGSKNRRSEGDLIQQDLIKTFYEVLTHPSFNPDLDDIFAKVVQSFETGISQRQTKIQLCHDGIKNLENVKKRLSKHKKKNAMFIPLVEGTIEEGEQEIRKLEEQIKHNERVIEAAKKFEYEVDDMEMHIDPAARGFSDHLKRILGSASADGIHIHFGK